jgi:quinol monooxygenase YgiN
VYVVTVEFAIKAAHGAEFMQALIENARASREREPGCRQFDVCTLPDDVCTVFLYEVYDDRGAFDAHLASAHFRTFDARVGPWIERKSARVYARADP